MHEVTFNGLHMWGKHLFENLGWMILCKEHNSNPYKIKAYKESINQLIIHLNDYKKKTNDNDKKRDLTTLITNVTILKKFSQKVL